jgi:hypothetical protein
MNNMNKYKEDVLKQNIESRAENCDLNNKSLDDVVLEVYAKYVEKIESHAEIINAYKGYPIIQFEISFSDVLKNSRMYGLYFNKYNSNKFFRTIFMCGGACAIRLSDGIKFKGIKYDVAYVIIINRDKRRLVSKDMIEFIKLHELAHILNGNLENDYSYTGHEEFKADLYAKKKGFRYSTSVLNMTLWETNSYNYIGTSKNFFWGLFYSFFGFFKHYFINLKRSFV